MKNKISFFLLNSKYCVVFLFSIFYFLFSFTSAQAARLFLSSDVLSAGVNQQFEVSLKLDSQNESLNVIEAEIAKSDNLNLVSIKDGDSIVGFWIEKPNEKNGKIAFSGMMPGGYEGIINSSWQGFRPGNVLSLVLEAKKTGMATILINNARVWLNDGKGTETSIFMDNLAIPITEKPTSEMPAREKDTVPPEEFAPIVTQDPNIYDNKWSLIFKTRDLQTGIDHYEVIEKYPWFYYKNLFTFGGFKIAESPYLLKDQSLKSYIEIKAIDRGGNKKIEEIEPHYGISWYENYLIWIIITLIIFCLYIFFRRSRLKNKIFKNKN